MPAGGHLIQNAQQGKETASLLEIHVCTVMSSRWQSESAIRTRINTGRWR